MLKILSASLRRHKASRWYRGPADMEVHMLADMEVDKVADKVVDMVADKMANMDADMAADKKI